MPCASCKQTRKVPDKIQNVKYKPKNTLAGTVQQSKMADIDITGDDDETPLMTDDKDHTKTDTDPHIQTQPRRRLGCRLMDEIRPCLAEMVGVAIFVFLGTTSGTSENIISVAMAHGLTIMLLIIAFGNISGGHFNPCVTLGALLGGDITIVKSLFYWLAQILGGIIGAALNKGVLPSSVYEEIHAGIPDLGAEVTVAQGILCEATLTFVLVLTVLMTAVDRDDNMLAPVAIGLVVTVDISAAGGVSGAVMNPARAFGPSVVGTSVLYTQAWTHHYVYWVGPIIGALVAGTLYRLLLGSAHKRLICRE